MLVIFFRKLLKIKKIVSFFLVATYLTTNAQKNPELFFIINKNLGFIGYYLKMKKQK